MRRNYAILVSTLTADELEEFVNDWLSQRAKDYHSHELWRGTADMGRDVVGYASGQRMEGPWDNYQCKQLSTRLAEQAAFEELGKIFMHAANGAFSLPRAYTFVAPRGAVRAVKDFVAHPERFRQAFLDRWDAHIAGRLVENRTIPMTPAIEGAIRAFDFEQIHVVDAVRLIDDPKCQPVLVKWFDDDPGRAPRGVVPAEIQANESAYVGQLLKVYEEKGPGTFPNAEAALADAEYGVHLQQQRTRFFDSAAFDRFYRDSTPDDYLATFKDEVYYGVVDVHGDQHADTYSRLGKVMQQAAALQVSGILGKHAGPQVKQGTCHQFANEGRMPWHD